jgi:leucyl-tRNA synthetase
MSQQAQAEKAGAYRFREIETRWQRYWEEHGTFRTANPGESGFDSKRPKFYILDMFPYPSGAGLHVGHPIGYCATDIIARYKRMRGYNVLHPMGFDAFGLPAEQYAVETNVHPAVTTKKNIEVYRRQLKMFGFSYDWSREFATCDPGYYRWTQWMFIQMVESWYDAECRWSDAAGRTVQGRARPITELRAELESGRWGVDVQLRILRSREQPGFRPWKQLTEAEQRKVLDSVRLAHMDEVPVNWCPALGTVLANEEVDNEGRSERGGHPVYRRPLRQWMLRITCYAERLLADLDGLDWPEPIKLMQRNWVGKSTGAEVDFPLIEGIGGKQKLGSAASSQESIPETRSGDFVRVFTTRPDTLFGATYVVLAPEHPLVQEITTKERRAEVDGYVAAARNRSDLDRTAETKEKTGVFTGAHCTNPVNGHRIPIWVADYVLMGYGTGAIMAVPGSDTRDFAFAVKFGLPIVAVVRPSEAWIQGRVAAMTEGLEAAAADGFAAVAESFPELRESIEQRRRQAERLGERTVDVLRNRVGLSRLVEHYVRHPRSWGAAFVEDGAAVNSPAEVNTERESRSALRPPPPATPKDVCVLNGLATAEAKEKIIEWIEAHGFGRRKVQYKLRDWLFSRQRYWGEPFPVLHSENGETLTLKNEDLPLELPAMNDFKPSPVDDAAHSLPQPPLARARGWLSVARDGRRFRRDLNTMPNWAGSCWYYLRFIDPHNSARAWGEEPERYWMPVDLYLGGAEHAVLHLLYARFWHKVLYDLGCLSTPEPFQRLFNQGKIQGYAFRDRRGSILGPDAVEERGEDQFVAKATGEPVTRIIAKMSKSLKNTVNPDDVIAGHGADTFRLYEMYMGPLETDKPWNTRDVPGLHKLCQRIWRLVVDEQTGHLNGSLSGDAPDDEALRALHKLIRRVTEDLEVMKFNTGIAAIFDFVNVMTPRDRRPRAVIEPFLLVLAPFAPHLAEELWSRLGHGQSLAYESWPTFDPAFAHDAMVEVGVQVNGKLKSRLMAAADADESTLERSALADARVMEALQGKTVRKVIVVKGRLVNVVAN